MPEYPVEAAQAAVDAAGSVDRARPEGWKRDEWRTHCHKNGVRVQRNTQTAPGKIEWGQGPAKLIRPCTTTATETVVSLSDVHYPYQDDRAVASALSLVRELQPHRVILNGDIADFFMLSRFDTSGERVDKLQDEIDMANGFRRAVREAAPNAHLVETQGNHDERIITYVKNNARPLASLRALEPSALFMYDELEIDFFTGAGFLLRPEFLVRHGTVARGEAGASAKAEFMQAGISGLSGHTHRLAKYIKGGYVQREWSEQGCLCRLDPDYVKGGVPNWVQGVAVGQFSTRSSAFSLELVQAVNGRLWFGGKEF